MARSAVPEHTPFDFQSFMECTVAGGGRPRISEARAPRHGGSLVSMVQRVSPYLLYGDAGAAIEYLERVFGCREILRYTAEDGRVSHAELRCPDGGDIMLGQPGTGYCSPHQLGGITTMIHVYVDDVDAHYARAREAGAVIERELTDQPFGDRSYGATDLEGHQWFFATRVKEVAPEEWGAVSAPSRNVEKG